MSRQGVLTFRTLIAESQHLWDVVFTLLIGWGALSCQGTHVARTFLWGRVFNTWLFKHIGCNPILHLLLFLFIQAKLVHLLHWKFLLIALWWGFCCRTHDLWLNINIRQCLIVLSRLQCRLAIRGTWIKEFATLLCQHLDEADIM